MVRRIKLSEAGSRAGHTQESLADALHVSARTVGRWEAGTCSLYPSTRRDLASELELSLDQLSTVISTSNDATIHPNATDSTTDPIRAAHGWLIDDVPQLAGATTGAQHIAFLNKRILLQV
ncbi:helix-turn-helix domain-containing protein [Natronoglycomyces albus]|uniref:Helix-turn-helix transcriptional regulator n=1 Tax=Natronoglycomyces albus TaxID=2811108 RepID=A0A895XLS8_9ACTN|nr:helix-turn-helix transcriptional regulator [Natronoglycomyces albus]